jgi:hypothetical protein
MSTNPSHLPDSDVEAGLDRALDELRRDLGSVRPAPDLAERVLGAARVGDVEVRRFHRYARAYAAAAALLLALGAAGAWAARRPAPDPERTLADLEASRLAIEQAVSVADLAVGGR